MPNIKISQLQFLDLPEEEDTSYEFKSSKCPWDNFKKKLSCAVSGFAHSGGGVIIWGVNDNGHADGGIDRNIGNQSLKDCCDQIIKNVSPFIKREYNIYDNCDRRGELCSDKVIAAISIFASELGPFQAYDKKYYIRAGAHTEPAQQAIVEALWSRRHFQKPKLVHITRVKPSDSHIIQIGVISATNAPALNVEVTISPIKERDFNKNILPFIVPLVDQDNPFYFDFTFYKNMKETLTEDVEISVTYNDLLGNTYSYKNEQPLTKSLGNIFTRYKS